VHGGETQHAITREAARKELRLSVSEKAREPKKGRRAHEEEETPKKLRDGKGEIRGARQRSNGWGGIARGDKRTGKSHQNGAQKTKRTFNTAENKSLMREGVKNQKPSRGHQKARASKA